EAMTSTNPPVTVSPQELDTLLARAAELASANDVDLDEFVKAAWSAFVDARPGLRQQLEDKQLKTELRKLRKRGLVGSA
ncbi:MAG: hypothetical protein ABI867_25185, partial [Kofleriaceae bacterium]